MYKTAWFTCSTELIMKMISKVLVLCHFLSAVSSSYFNAYDHPFVFKCPSGQSISNIESRHDNDYEDRQFGFRCKSTEGLGSCSWSEPLNSYDENVFYRCPGVITGMASTHNNHRQDRVFQYYCCSIARVLTNCGMSGYVNDFDGHFNYDVPGNLVLKGVSSYHSNPHEDRRFRFETCYAN